MKDDKIFSIVQNCKTVLLADADDFNGVFSITAIPLRDSNTNLTSIDSIQIQFGATIYLINEKEIKVWFKVFNFLSSLTLFDHF